MKNTKEKICAFYASDYHFEMMSLPYIDKKMDKNEEVIILTESNLEKTMKTLLEKTNLKEEKRERILKINWKNEDQEKCNRIKKEIKQNKNMIIFIKGKEKYIHHMNQNIENWITDENNIKIIDCYDMEEIGENMEQVMNQYNKILKTTGEKEIEKL